MALLNDKINIHIYIYTSTDFYSECMESENLQKNWKSFHVPLLPASMENDKLGIAKRSMIGFVEELARRYGDKA